MTSCSCKNATFLSKKTIRPTRRDGHMASQSGLGTTTTGPQGWPYCLKGGGTAYREFSVLFSEVETLAASYFHLWVIFKYVQIIWEHCDKYEIFFQIFWILWTFFNCWYLSKQDLKCPGLIFTRILDSLVGGVCKMYVMQIRYPEIMIRQGYNHVNGYNKHF